MDRITLSLKSTPPKTVKNSKSIAISWLAIIFGILGILSIGIIFVPLCLIFSISAIFVRRFVFGVIGLCLSLVGLITSPTLLFLLGKEVLFIFISWSDLIKIFSDFFGVDGLEV